jgi:hypothetical protein
VAQRDDPRHRTPTLRLASLAGALVSIALGLCAGSAHAASLDGFYGVNVQQVFSGSSASWQPQLSAMQSGGLQLARIDARWASVEPNAPGRAGHSYNWAMYDGIVQALAQHGLRWYPIVGYSTSWASVVPGDSSAAVAPAHVGDFANYAWALARRYGRGGTFWASHPSLPQLPVTDYEIWNEENSTAFLRPQGNAPEAYADLFMAARAAIKPVDANAKVVIGGLALGNNGGADETQFIQRMFAHRPDLKGHVDAVGLHPYQVAVADVYRRIALFRQAYDRLDSSRVPIELTELGWASTSVSDAQRGQNLSHLASELPRSDCNVSRLLVYSWTSAEQNGSRADDWFGIYNHNATPKGSGSTFLGTVKTMLSGSAPRSVVHICHATTPRVPPVLRMYATLGHGHTRLTVVARCPHGCSYSLALVAQRAAGALRVAHRTGHFSARRRNFRFRITHKLRRRYPVVQLQIVARGRNGAKTSRTAPIALG